MDASVLPENLGVNPQHTIMATVFRAAERLAS
jgi:choline dehydrogenase-like flavoprotein